MFKSPYKKDKSEILPLNPKLQQFKIYNCVLNDCNIVIKIYIEFKLYHI